METTFPYSLWMQINCGSSYVYSYHTWLDLSPSTTNQRQQPKFLSATDLAGTLDWSCQVANSATHDSYSCVPYQLPQLFLYTLLRQDILSSSVPPLMHMLLYPIGKINNRREKQERKTFSPAGNPASLSSIFMITSPHTTWPLHTITCPLVSLMPHDLATASVQHLLLILLFA